jgi:hypothetical protein
MLKSKRSANQLKITKIEEFGRLDMNQPGPIDTLQ